MAAVSEDEEARTEAQLRETEMAIEELKKKRAELLRAKEAIRWAKTKASTSKGATAAAPTQPAVPSTAASSEPVQATAASTKALAKTLDSLEWSSFKKKEGEWTFLRNRDGSLVDALGSETEFVNQLRRGKDIVVGKYRYVVSEDKFLNRHYHA